MLVATDEGSGVGPFVALPVLLHKVMVLLRICSHLYVTKNQESLPAIEVITRAKITV